MPINSNPLPSPAFRNVLIVRFSALGDVAMTIPVVYSVCTAHPSIHFVMLTQKAPANLFVNVPANLEVVAADTKGAQKTSRAMFNFARDLHKKYHFDAVADIHSVIRSWVVDLATFSAKHAIINKGRAEKKALTRHSGKQMQPLISSRERYRRVFRELGLDCRETFVSLFNGAKAPTINFSAISNPKPDGEKWIAIAPFAKHKGKIYPIELMEQVLKTLATERPGTRIFLCGGGDYEKEILRRWANQYENVHSLAEKHYGFLAELSLLSHCDVMVTMDSANMHLASIVGLQAVSIWGATHPYCGFMGWHQSEDNIVQNQMACRPCSVYGNKKCKFGDYYCLAGISPARIIAKVDEILNR